MKIILINKDLEDIYKFIKEFFIKKSFISNYYIKVLNIKLNKIIIKLIKYI
jgi:hypothetical protein